MLVTRPEPGASETAARLLELGFRPVIAPATIVESRKINVASLPQAVLVTSGNAIPALPESLLDVPLLAVGDATAARAKAAGFLTVHSAGRDAEALVELVTTLCRPTAGPLLLASGEGLGDDLVAVLQDRGFRVERRIAYAARPVESLPEEATAALSNGTLRAALFFSPQSARVFVTILQRDLPALNVRGIEALAISSQTGAALAVLPWQRIRVASNPNQEDLLKLLQMTEPTESDPAFESHVPPPATTPPPPQPDAAASSPTSGDEPSKSGEVAAPQEEAAASQAGEGSKPPSIPVLPVPSWSPPPPRPPADAALPPATRARPARTALPVLTALGFALLVGAYVWLWTKQQDVEREVASLASQPTLGAAGKTTIDSGRLAALDARLNVVEQKLDEMASRPATVEAPAPEHAQASAPASVSEQPAPSSEASSALARQIASLEQRLQDDEQQQSALATKDGVAAQIASLDKRLKEAEQRQATQAVKEAKEQRLQLAALLLDAGEPLGDLPDAPPALTRYAKTRPPTEAALRLSFPIAADKAQSASQPSTVGKSLGERILMHASSLLTVKDGDKILVGAPAATILGVAQQKLRAGDLAGAVAALDGLDPNAAKAMSGWRAEAQALLDARDALAELARS